MRDGAAEVHVCDGEECICNQLVLDSIYKQVLITHRWGDSRDSKYRAMDKAEWAICAPIVSSDETDGDYALYLSRARVPVGDSSGSRTLPEEQLSLVAIAAEILQSMAHAGWLGSL